MYVCTTTKHERCQGAWRRAKSTSDIYTCNESKARYSDISNLSIRHPTPTNLSFYFTREWSSPNFHGHRNKNVIRTYFEAYKHRAGGKWHELLYSWVNDAGDPYYTMDGNIRIGWTWRLTLNVPHISVHKTVVYTRETQDAMRSPEAHAVLAEISQKKTWKREKKKIKINTPSTGEHPVDWRQFF